VRAEPVDPRDTNWEVGEPAYRVYFWSQPRPGEMWVSDEWELTGADVTGALRWANDNADSRRFVLYARIDTAQGPGLIHLLGIDPTRPDCS
jgi:hypothetical protein